MDCEGIIIGCDQNQEWLLPWWWENYAKHNSHPVAFADFGMSREGIAWASERGFYFEAPEIASRVRREVLPERKRLWEEHYGEKIWTSREVWFRKPFAMGRSPFPFSIWIDLDCRVRGSLEPLFQLLRFGAEIAMKRENDEIQEKHREKGLLAPGEINYNCGVIAYQRDAAVLKRWMEEIRQASDAFPFDQQALSRVLCLYPTALVELPASYNWSPWDGRNPYALIYHFHGGTMKNPAFMEMFP